MIVPLAHFAPLSRQGLVRESKGSGSKGFSIPRFQDAIVMSLHILYGIVNGGRQAGIRGIFGINSENVSLRLEQKKVIRNIIVLKKGFIVVFKTGVLKQGFGKSF